MTPDTEENELEAAVSEEPAAGHEAEDYAGRPPQG